VVNIKGSVDADKGIEIASGDEDLPRSSDAADGVVDATVESVACVAPGGIDIPKISRRQMMATARLIMARLTTKPRHSRMRTPSCLLGNSQPGARGSWCRPGGVEDGAQPIACTSRYDSSGKPRSRGAKQVGEPV
jgi:hypothetical protein